MRFLYLILSLLVIQISGCALVKTTEVQPDPDEEGIYETPLAAYLDASMVAWYESLARINFVAVIPARSDIEVGDIYLTWDHKKAEAAKDRLQRMVKRQLWASSIVPEDVSNRQTEFDLIDLPFVAVGSRESSDLIEVVPSNIASDRGSFHMRPTAGRIASQPLHDILEWLEDDTADEGGPIRLEQKYWHNLDVVSADRGQPVWLHVVTEILYMHSLDMKLSGQLDLDIPENVEATTTTEIPQDEDENGANSEPEDSGAEAKEDAESSQEPATVQMETSEEHEITVTQETNAFTRALAINEILEAQGLDDNFGETTKLIFIDDDDVVLRTSLPKPVAIGLRGLRLQVNPLNGEVILIQAWQP